MMPPTIEEAIRALVRGLLSARQIHSRVAATAATGPPRRPAVTIAGKAAEKTVKKAVKRSLAPPESFREDAPPPEPRKYHMDHQQQQPNPQERSITVEDAIELIQGGEDESEVVDTLLESMMAGLFPSRASGEDPRRRR